MSSSIAALLVFLAVVSVAALVGLVFREWQGAHRPPQEIASTPRLQRVKPMRFETNASGPLAKFDRWFLLLLREGGSDWNPVAIVALAIAFGALCGFALFVWDEREVPALIAGFAGVILPLAFLLFRRARRQAKLEEQLPPAMETLARSIRAGRSLQQAIALVGEHSPEPLAKEFRWCARQMEMGLPLPAVMRTLLDRVRLYDLRMLATTLIVHHQAGGNVVNVLERLAQVVRERLNYRRQLRATTAAGRMSAGLIAILAPGVFIYFFFFRPEYVSTVLQSTVGQSTLVLALILEIVGIIWMARLVRPTY